MKVITDKEEMIVKATQHLAEIHLKYGYVPDYECIKNKFNLTPEEYRGWRDVCRGYCLQHQALSILQSLGRNRRSEMKVLKKLFEMLLMKDCLDYLEEEGPSHWIKPDGHWRKF